LSIGKLRSKLSRKLLNSYVFILIFMLVSYIRNHIPCSCLDGKYKQVKSITKIGHCANEDCSHPGRMVERNAMKHCTRCRREYYCSRKCQVADWHYHKQYCDAFAQLRDEFDWLDEEFDSNLKQEQETTLQKLLGLTQPD
jgi:hypothetical protein